MAVNGTEVGENVRYTMKDGVLTISIDTAHRGDRSATGKTIRVSSTGGNVPIATPDGVVYLGLNVYVK